MDIATLSLTIEGQAVAKNSIPSNQNDTERYYLVIARVGRSNRYYNGKATSMPRARRATLKHYRDLYPDRDVEVVSVRQL